MPSDTKKQRNLQIALWLWTFASCGESQQQTRMKFLQQKAFYFYFPFAINSTFRERATNKWKKLLIQFQQPACGSSDSFRFVYRADTLAIRDDEIIDKMLACGINYGEADNDGATVVCKLGGGM